MRARGKRWWERPVWMFPFPSLSFPHLPPSLSSNPWSLSTWNLGMEVMELKVADRFTLMDYLPPKGKACWTTSISTQWAVWVLSGAGAEAEWEWGLPVSLPLHGVEPWLLTLALLEPALGLPAHPCLALLLWTSPTSTTSLTPCVNFVVWERMSNPTIQV